MKKRIFIAIHYLEIGGAEISLIGLLNALDLSRYDVDLFVYSHRGPLMAYVPEGVNLLPEIPEYARMESPLRGVLRDGYWRLALARLWAKMRHRLYVWRKHPVDGSAIFQYVAGAVTPILPSLHHLGTYDLAVSFLTPHNIVRDKVLARRKVCWIHTDYDRIDVNENMELPVWGAYDSILSIAPDVTRNFCLHFPSLKEKIVEVPNILSPAFVRDRSMAMTADEVAHEMPQIPGVVNLLSVGRFCPPKNYDNVPLICRRLLALGCNVRWYIIGFGGDEALIRQRIAQTGMEEHVILLGKRENPYPYIRACHVYVQPSRYEGNSVTVREAQMLCRPVVVARYPTAASQVADGEDGVIVPLENEGCARGLAAVLRDAPLQQRLIAYLRSHDYGNEAEIEKFENLIP